MIKLDKGYIEYQGDSATLMAEVTMCLREFLEVSVITEKDLDFIVDMAKKTREELYKDAALKMLGAMVSTLGEDATRNIINGGEEK